MANLVKIKRAGIIISIGVCVLLYFRYELNSRYYKNNRFYYWSPELELSKSDFMSAEPIFKKRAFSATITMRYFYEKTPKGEYRVKPVIDRHMSFMRLGHYSEALLKHEKYHANICSYLAKEMNDILTDSIFNFENDFLNFLDYYETKTRELFDEYDMETNHGRIYEMQKYWEQKIDSLLMN